MLELLIVLGIIAVLSSILIGLVGNGRDAAKRTMCVSNVRMLCLATVSYATDNSGRLPMPNFGEQGAPYQAGWLYTAPFPDGDVPADKEYMRTGLIWKYVQSVDAYRCPAHPAPYENNASKSGNQYGANTEWVTSYLMNGAVSSYGTVKPAHRVAQFPPDGVMIWEAAEFNAPFNDGSSYPDESDAKRHVTGSTYGCFDGHAEYIRTPDFHDMRRQPPPNRLWCAPDRPNGGWHGGQRSPPTGK